jgi:hypothetical protein
MSVTVLGKCLSLPRKPKSAVVSPPGWVESPYSYLAKDEEIIRSFIRRILPQCTAKPTSEEKLFSFCQTHVGRLLGQLELKRRFREPPNKNQITKIREKLAKFYVELDQSYLEKLKVAFQEQNNTYLVLEGRRLNFRANLASAGGIEEDFDQLLQSVEYIERVFNTLAPEKFRPLHSNEPLLSFVRSMCAKYAEVTGKPIKAKSSIQTLILKTIKPVPTLKGYETSVRTILESIRKHGAEEISKTVQKRRRS